MERVAFLVEATNQRISAMLNPDHVTIRRVAGVRARASLGGAFTGDSMVDDPLLFTGGGRTEIELLLLFDVQLGETPDMTDVRDLTIAFWTLTQSQRQADGTVQLPIIRFIWGKAWNVPGVIAALSETLENFSSDASPQRSWLRMKLIRVAEPGFRSESDLVLQPSFPLTQDFVDTPAFGTQPSASDDQTQVYETQGEERLDLIAARYYGSPFYWRLIAAANRIADPNNVPPGTILTIPPITRAARGEDAN